VADLAAGGDLISLGSHEVNPIDRHAPNAILHYLDLLGMREVQTTYKPRLRLP